MNYKINKLKYLKIEKTVFEFNKNTENLEFVALRDNKALEEMVFKTPQPKLKYIDASRCNISKITFSHLCENLETLYLSKNQLTTIEFNENTPKLKLIDLSFNKSLTEIKLNTYLEDLRFLYLHKCNIKSLQNLADYFIKRDNNKKLILDFNIEENENITSPPLEIVKQGKAAVVNYYLQIDKEKGKTQISF